MSSTGDLTARARIRDAAIELFAERGIGGATIRDIAQAAGVSSGLLRHHFGSKEGLRDACDEYAMAEIARIRAPYIEGGAGNERLIYDAIRAAPLRLQSYLIRSTLDGSPSGANLFQRMVGEAEQWYEKATVKSADPRAYAAVLCALQMGMFMMRDQISVAIGEDTRQPHGHLRMLRAAVEIFAQPLLLPEQAEQAYAALDRLMSTPEES
ncbi:TetR/AcrR family transcriptional regulator [Couchioplanes caeruleus]|uniref:TetR/AcrR family transcriptional regulator n=1 Tax=Couchioplanes caeruleus TaxID=56438 RepID=UPI0023DFCB56|nr:TetR/AcrR family transcriptional regulator [Couchioplanes caeruleus]